MTMNTQPTGSMLTLKAARAMLAKGINPLPARSVAVPEARGCRLAESPHAALDCPEADVSVMDGYAARAADLAAHEPLPVAFEIPTGRVPEPLPAGAIARIFTGAWLPAGADAVVPQEEARIESDGRVCLPVVEAGRFVRHHGEVVRRGDMLAEAGEVVTPQLMGLLVATGPREVRVIPRPRIGILTTGSELLAPDEPLRPATIYDSNGPMLKALAAEALFEAEHVRRVADDLQATRQVIKELAMQVDLLVTSGGVSVGDYDLVPRALRDVGADLLFHRIAVKPGKPILVARIHNCMIVGLPGNPASAFVGWYLFVKPIAERLAGNPLAFKFTGSCARLLTPALNRSDRTLFAPARLSRTPDGMTISVLPSKGSHDLVAVAHADALAIMDPGIEKQAGETVEYIPTDRA
jgi:molybdopterin molybdotransferase